MNEEKSKKKNDKLVIIALLLAFLTLTVGFLSYTASTELTNKFNQSSYYLNYFVGFSKYDNKLVPGNIEPTVMKIDPTSKSPKAQSVIFNNKTITNIDVEFKDNGTYVIYKFYVYNDGEYDVFLKEIIFDKVKENGAKKVCIPINDNDYKYMDKICDSISIGVVYSGYADYTLTSSVTDIKNVKLKSEAAIIARCALMPPSRGRNFMFTDNFVLFLAENGKRTPYYAMKISDVGEINKTGKKLIDCEKEHKKEEVTTG